MGTEVGFVPVVNATVVTEVQSLTVLTSVRATHVASGGVAGSEGSVILSLEGSDEVVSRAFRLVESIKGEAPIELPNLVPA